jgi:hypothetical protein
LSQEACWWRLIRPGFSRCCAACTLSRCGHPPHRIPGRGEPPFGDIGLPLRRPGPTRGLTPSSPSHRPSRPCRLPAQGPARPPEPTLRPGSDCSWCSRSSSAAMGCQRQGFDSGVRRQLTHFRVAASFTCGAALSASFSRSPGSPVGPQHLENHGAERPARIGCPLRVRRGHGLEGNAPTIPCELSEVESVKAHTTFVRTC